MATGQSSGQGYRVAVVVFSTETPTTTDGLVATHSGTGGRCRRVQVSAPARKEPTSEAIAEFFKGIPFHEGPVEVVVPMMLSDLHSRGELDRIRVDVKGM
jgi:hypothetical protein